MKNGVTVFTARTHGGWCRWQLLDYGSPIVGRSGLERTRQDAKHAGYLSALEYTKQLARAKKTPAAHHGHRRNHNHFVPTMTLQHP